MDLHRCKSMSENMETRSHIYCFTHFLFINSLAFGLAFGHFQINPYWTENCMDFKECDFTFFLHNTIRKRKKVHKHTLFAVNQITVSIYPTPTPPLHSHNISRVYAHHQRTFQSVMYSPDSRRRGQQPPLVADCQINKLLPSF